MPDFAEAFTTKSSIAGQTLYPYDLTRTPGGLSGGTAVAVTANLAVVGLGTDSCGSIRRPSAWNNLYGLRPTPGRTSRTGLIPLSFTLDTIGPMARRIVDLAILLDVVAGQDPDDPKTVPHDGGFTDAATTTDLTGRRVGVISTAGTPEAQTQFEQAVDDLRAVGAEIVDAAPGSRGSEGSIVAIIGAEGSASIARYAETHPGLPLEDHDRAVRDSTTYRAALADRAKVHDRLVGYLDDNDLDAYLYPTVAAPAPPLGTEHPWPNCVAASMGSLPALSVPSGTTPAGLPVAIELMGRPADEATLISIAAAYESRTQHRHPPQPHPTCDRPEPPSSRLSRLVRPGQAAPTRRRVTAEPVWVTLPAGGAISAR